MVKGVINKVLKLPSSEDSCYPPKFRPKFYKCYIKLIDFQRVFRNARVVIVFNDTFRTYLKLSSV